MLSGASTFKVFPFFKSNWGLQTGQTLKSIDIYSLGLCNRFVNGHEVMSSLPAGPDFNEMVVLHQNVCGANAKVLKTGPELSQA